jgi:hypothetical protein
MQTERVTFLTTAEQKAALDAFAAERGESVGNVVREAAARYMAEPSEDEEILAALVSELAQAVPAMKASLERSAQIMRETSEEVDRMLREAGLRK